jgi:hypothetical protein
MMVTRLGSGSIKGAQYGVVETPFSHLGRSLLHHNPARWQVTIHLPTYSQFRTVFVRRNGMLRPEIQYRRTDVWRLGIP